MRNIEHDILSTCMFNSDNMQTAMESGVMHEWFDDSKDGDMFTALFELVAVTRWNKRDNILVMQSGKIFDKHPMAMGYCEETPQWAHSIEDFKSAIDVLRSNHASRKVLIAATGAINEIGKGEDPFTVMDSMGATLETLNETSDKESRSIEEITDEAFKISQMIADGKPFGLPFPWRNFQLRTLGIPSKAVTPLAGRDGKGKSRLATCLTEYWVTREIPILYFAFEDTAERMVSNLAATYGGYDMFSIRRGAGTPEFMDKHREALRRVAELPLHVCDRSATVERLVTEIAIHKRKYGIRGVVVDGFKDLITSVGENQTQKENHIMAALVRAAKEYDVAIIPVMHLTKIEDGQWISKRSIKGAGSQTQSARAVLVFQDSGFPDGMKSVYGGMDDTIVLEAQKTSYGDTGSVVLRPELERGRFVEIAPEGRE